MSVTIGGANILAVNQALLALSQQRMPPGAARHFAAVARAIRDLVVPIAEEVTSAREESDERLSTVLADISGRSFAVNARPVPLEFIGAAQITPAEFEALSPFFTEPANAA